MKNPGEEELKRNGEKTAFSLSLAAPFQCTALQVGLWDGHFRYLKKKVTLVRQLPT
jgi:hypothetical protein